MAAILTKIHFAPNVIKDDSPLNAEGAIIDSDKMRNSQGSWQTILGWEKAVGVGGENGAGAVDGPARGMHNWTDLNGLKQLAIGTPNKLWALTDGDLIDVTPNHSEGVLFDPFDTTNGSDIVTVHHSEHGFRPGDFVTFSHADAGGGITVDGEYEVKTTPTRDTYTIEHGSNASSNQTTVGGYVDFVGTFAGGLTDGTGGLGYGTGVYSAGTYGLPSSNQFLASVWTFGNFGETLIACRRGGPLYAWQPATAYLEILLNGDFASATGWATGTGWSIGSGHATATAGVQSNLNQNITGLVRAGQVYRITFDVTRSAGTVKFRVNAGETPTVIDVGINSAGDSASKPINKTGTYSRLFVMPDKPSDIVFEKDGSFAGQIDNVSLKLESKAYFIDQAPRLIDVCWVDPSARIVCIGGTYEADGDYNPTLVRNSAQENYRVWVPDGSNLADEFALGAGGRIVKGLATRQQTLIWTDNAVFSQQFNGESYSYRMLGTGCGLAGTNAAAEINGQVFWLSNSGNFYTFQGAIPQVIISCRVRRDCVSNIAANQSEKVYCWINTDFNEAWWHYPDQRDGNECSRVVVYNWLEDHFVTHMFDRTAGVSGGIFPSPILVSSSGEIFYHERGNSANGGALAAYLTTSYFDIEDGNNLLAVLALVPDFHAQQGNVFFEVMTKPFPNGTELSFGPYTSQPTKQRIPFRIMARQAKLKIYSSQAPSFWVLSALRAEIQKTGALR